MHCIILLPDAAGRVPTAQELRQRGFAVSTAVAVPEPCLAAARAGAPLAGQAQAPALAAEEPAPYGQLRPPEH
jgi:hypothetical protein